MSKAQRIKSIEALRGKMDFEEINDLCVGLGAEAVVISIGVLYVFDDASRFVYRDK